MMELLYVFIIICLVLYFWTKQQLKQKESDLFSRELLKCDKHSWCRLEDVLTNEQYKVVEKVDNIVKQGQLEEAFIPQIKLFEGLHCSNCYFIAGTEYRVTDWNEYLDKINESRKLVAEIELLEENNNNQT